MKRDGNLNVINQAQEDFLPNWKAERTSIWGVWSIGSSGLPISDSGWTHIVCPTCVCAQRSLWAPSRKCTFKILLGKLMIILIRAAIFWALYYTLYFLGKWHICIWSSLVAETMEGCQRVSNEDPDNLFPNGPCCLSLLHLCEWVPLPGIPLPPRYSTFPPWLLVLANSSFFLPLGNLPAPPIQNTELFPLWFTTQQNYLGFNYLSLS